MTRLVGLCTLVAAAVLATSAAAAAPGSFSFAFPLPPLGHGSIYEVVLKYKLPAGSTVTGTPFTFHVANGSTVPGYIRAAYAVAANGPATWDIFVGINAPTSTNERRLASSSAPSTLPTTLQANPVAGATTTASEPSKADACRAWLKANGITFYVMIGASESEGAEIMNFIKSDDSHCK